MKAWSAGTRALQQRWVLIASVAVVVALSLVLLLLLTQATQNWDAYQQYYTALFVLNGVVAGVLLFIIGWFAWRLWQRLRKGRFGSRLLVKLAAIFALVGIAPGLLIYGVSYQFVTRSIEAWFDSKVEVALDAGLNLTRTTLDAMAQDLSAKTRGVAVQLSDVTDAAAPLALEKAVEQLGVTDMVLWSGNGVPLASAGAARYQLNPERPSATDLRQVKSNGLLLQIEGLDEGVKTPDVVPRIQALVSVGQPGLGLRSEQRLLQVTQNLPTALVTNAHAVLDANREYQERALARDGLRRMYVGTLTLSLFLAVFGAVLLAVLLGNQLARPLLVLAAGVRDVAAGDLSPKPALQGRDELDGLTAHLPR